VTLPAACLAPARVSSSTSSPATGIRRECPAGRPVGVRARVRVELHGHRRERNPASQGGEASPPALAPPELSRPNLRHRDGPLRMAAAAGNLVVPAWEGTTMPGMDWVAVIQAILAGSVDVQGHRAMAVAPSSRLVMWATVALVTVFSTQHDAWFLAIILAIWSSCAGSFMWSNWYFATSKDHPFEKYDLLSKAVQNGMIAGDLIKLSRAIEAVTPQHPQPSPQAVIPLPGPSPLRPPVRQKQQPPIVTPQAPDQGAVGVSGEAEAVSEEDKKGSVPS
jgi:hypothetical protein